MLHYLSFLLSFTLEWDRLDIRQYSFLEPWITMELDILRSLPQLERLYTQTGQANLWLILPHVISQRRLTTYHVNVSLLEPIAAMAIWTKHLQRCNDFLPDVTDLKIPFQFLEYIASKKVIKLTTAVTGKDASFFHLLSRYRTTLTHLEIVRYITSESELTPNFINQLAEAAPLTEDLSLSCYAMSNVVSTFSSKSV
jgi:hypothetical protein